MKMLKPIPGVEAIIATSREEKINPKYLTVFLIRENLFKTRRIKLNMIAAKKIKKQYLYAMLKS